MNNNPDSQPNGVPGRRRSSRTLRKLSQSPTIGRFVISNHFNRTVERLAETQKFPRLAAFLPWNLWPWLWSYLKYAFTPKAKFRTYEGKNKNGVYQLSPLAGNDSIRLAVAGDWGTGTQEAFEIAELMRAAKPELTIHLGDVYYVGDEPEIEENCFGKASDGYDGVEWPYGSRGSFALNGNHEMYASGGPYFEKFLPRLGLRGDGEGQVASFFCLETADWRIIAIDTGYNSTGLPILGAIPWINKIPGIGGNCRLEDGLMEWLRREVKPQANPKPTVILSHHQRFSAFPSESEYTRPAKQLAEFLRGQEFVWLWGHEHRLGLYEPATREDITFYARCMGHGGMPVELAEPDTAKAPLERYDARTQEVVAETPVGFNGFVNLTLRGKELDLEYVDKQATVLFVERFAPGENGKLTRTILKDPGLLTKM